VAPRAVRTTLYFSPQLNFATELRP
jgi:hypothetical protein